MNTTVIDRDSGLEASVALDPWTHGNRLLGYDPQLRRLWIGGQRLHHGATGIALAATGLLRFSLRRRGARGRGLGWLLAAGALMAHDWKDRSVWFRPGSQHDPS
jgi:hypothetical protein